MMSQFDEIDEINEINEQVKPIADESEPVIPEPDLVSDPETVSAVTEEETTDAVDVSEPEKSEAESETVEPSEAEPEVAESEEDQANKPYHKRYYLLFGEDELPECIAPDKTLDFLNSLRYDGGELKQARRSKDGSSIIRDILDSGDECCSYCGVPITGVDYYRLPDGRKRCTRCSRSLVKSLEDLEGILKEVRNNMEVFFNASIDVPIKVMMLDEKKLKKKIKHPLGGSNDQAVILGAAVNKKGDYTIYLENSAPRVSVIATMAHELTHIWQYTHWKQKNLRAKYGNTLVLMEGMAEWCEVQYLYHIGEEAAAIRERIKTEQRNDEYGNGFRLYEKEYRLSTKPMVFLATPFDDGNDPFEQN